MRLDVVRLRPRPDVADGSAAGMPLTARVSKRVRRCAPPVTRTWTRRLARLAGLRDTAPPEAACAAFWSEPGKADAAPVPLRGATVRNGFSAGRKRGSALMPRGLTSWVPRMSGACARTGCADSAKLTPSAAAPTAPFRLRCCILPVRVRLVWPVSVWPVSCQLSGISVHARIATGSSAGRMVNRDKTGMVKGV